MEGRQRRSQPYWAHTSCVLPRMARSSQRDGISVGAGVSGGIEGESVGAMAQEKLQDVKTMGKRPPSDSFIRGLRDTAASVGKKGVLMANASSSDAGLRADDEESLRAEADKLQAVYGWKAKQWEASVRTREVRRKMLWQMLVANGGRCTNNRKESQEAVGKTRNQKSTDREIKFTNPKESIHSCFDKTIELKEKRDATQVDQKAIQASHADNDDASDGLLWRTDSEVENGNVSCGERINQERSVSGRNELQMTTEVSKRYDSQRFIKVDADIGNLRAGELCGTLAEPYSVLRSFSRALRLSPFPMDALCAAVVIEKRNNLIDEILVALLTCLFKDCSSHFPSYVPPTEELAQEPLIFLDAITSTAFLIEYLSRRSWRKHIVEVGIEESILLSALKAMTTLGVQVYHLPLRTKVYLLCFLCQMVQCSATIRAELNRRIGHCEGGQLSSMYNIGSHLEVLAVSHKGEAKGWHMASVIAVSEKKVQVKFEETPSTYDEDAFEEWIDSKEHSKVLLYNQRSITEPSFRGSNRTPLKQRNRICPEIGTYSRLRPCREYNRHGYHSDLKVGDLVDVKLDQNPGWWEGEIIGKHDSYCSLVYFRWDGETRIVSNKNMRECLVWDRNGWVRAVDYRTRIDAKENTTQKKEKQVSQETCRHILTKNSIERARPWEPRRRPN